ncbi:MAG: stage V sporulation protein AC [Oscillospiraceae bacterium]|jgi:stage V sporulation protein AC|nr:stage V sporulation protein AC [Oscillospiraceae bacterium]
MDINMTKEEYGDYVEQKAPKSRLLGNSLRAFASGGLICCIGEGLILLYKHVGLGDENAKLLTSITLIFLGTLLTAFHVYDKIAKWAGAGTLVPITGFANSVASPAMEFKSEGMIAGMAAKMFIIAGPVIVFGITASAIFGVIYWLF